MNMEDAPVHPGHALAAQLGIPTEAGVQIWEQAQAAVQAAQQPTPAAGLQPQPSPFIPHITTPAEVIIKKKESPWPSWDGSTSTFPNYRSQLRVKIEEDRHLLGSDRAVCYGMLQTLPDNKKARAHGWFDRGGPDGAYNWEGFLRELSTLFEDKQAKQAAGEQLTRMRQGSCQHFADFIQDFEYKLQQCGGTTWAGNAKIMQLNASINNPLKTALITVDLPDEDYDQWKARVSMVAGRLEALPTYRPKGATHVKTWYAGSNGTSRAAQPTNGPRAAPRVDADGDTIMGGMSGINALAAAIVNAIKANPDANRPRSTGSGDTRPRAPWRPADAVRRLRDQGLCLRCEKGGHMARGCPTFRNAIRPGTGISATSATPAPAAATTSRVHPEEEEEDSNESKNGCP